MTSSTQSPRRPPPPGKAEKALPVLEEGTPVAQSPEVLGALQRVLSFRTPPADKGSPASAAPETTPPSQPEEPKAK